MLDKKPFSLICRKKDNAKHGFTLIELSIVLVIIGLIVGGVLVGQNLIAAGEVRATITQVEKYNTATNTFRGKFGYLPGDINPTAAQQFGFVARGTKAGEGDGNGLIEGIATTNGSSCSGACQSVGETAMFWVDLSSPVAGNLIDGGFNSASPITIPSTDITGTNINLYLPQAKLGRGNYFYVFSAYYWSVGTSFVNFGVNYFGLSAVSNIAASSNYGKIASTPNIPVAMAYAIDKKVDDGMPQSGNVMAFYLNTDEYWTDNSANSNVTDQPVFPTVTTTAITGSSTTCYDNGHVANATQNYSIEINSGAGANCALSFKLQ